MIKWLSNRYYIVDANNERVYRKEKKMYIMPRYYLIDDLNGTIVMWSLSMEDCERFYNINKMHLFYRK